MDLYSDLIVKNKENIERAAKDGKYQHAINYCHNIIKLKQKLYGPDNKSQNEEILRIFDFHTIMNEKSEAFEFLEGNIANLKEDDVLRLEIYLKRARFYKGSGEFLESIKEFQKAFEFQKKNLFDLEAKKEEKNAQIALVDSIKIATEIIELISKTGESQDLKKKYKEETLKLIERLKNKENLAEGFELL